nr:Protein DOS-3 [Haemonchus contortus]
MAVTTNAVPINLVRIACARNPSLAFCDSHLLGLPAGDITTATSTTTPSPVEHIPDYSGNEKEFLSWLNDQNDELDITVDERENHHSKLADKKEYCAKYKANFGHYCKNGIESKLEGVLPQFCLQYTQQCKGDGSEFPRPGPLPNSKKGTTVQPMADAAEPPTQIVGELPKNAAQEAAQAAQTEAFKGGVLQYCEKFADQFKHFCQGAQRSEFGKANEFCASYRDSCKTTEPSPVSKIPEVMEKPESSTASTASEETEEAPKPIRGPPAAPVPKPEQTTKPPTSSVDDLEEFPDSSEKGSSSQSSTEEEGQDKESTKDPKIQKYCDEFWENYNFYCAGDSTGHEKFCRSFRNNCPHKISS